MINLDELWRERTGLSEAVPPDFRRDWDRRIVPLLESPSRRWEARLEADELVNEWLLRGIMRLAQDIREKIGGSGADCSGSNEMLEKILEAVRSARGGGSGSDENTVEQMWNWIEKNPAHGEKILSELAQMGLALKSLYKEWGQAGVAGKLDNNGVALQGLRNALEDMGKALTGISERLDALSGRLDRPGENEALGRLKEQNGAILDALREMEERRKPAGLLARIRGSWKLWAAGLGAGLVLIVGAYFAGWEMRKSFYEHYWVELPESHEKGAWPPAGYDPDKAKWD